MNNLYCKVVAVMEEHEKRLKTKAKQNQRVGMGRGKTTKKKIELFHVNKCLAKIAKTSEVTVHNVRAIRDSKDEKLISEVCSGNLSISKAFYILMGGSPFSSVYFIKSENGKIKIGTTHYFDDRLRRLRLTCPCDLEVVGIMENQDKKFERKLHRKFKFCHSHGEWFDAHEDLLEYIAARSDGSMT